MSVSSSSGAQRPPVASPLGVARSAPTSSPTATAAAEPSIVRSGDELAETDAPRVVTSPTGIDTETLGFLVERGFDPVAFRGAQGQVRDGVVSARTATYPGTLSPPGPNDIGVLPARGTEEAQRLGALGEAALRNGEVAVVVLAGGMATRFGGGVKGAVDVTPGRSFLLEKLDDARKNAAQYGKPIPFCAMTSFATHEGVREHLAKHGAVEGEGIHLFEQRASVRLTPEGEVFLGDDGKPSLYAPGHGDFFEVIRTSGVLDELMQQGVRYVLFSNVDNLGATIDPRVIGFHIDQGADMTAEVTQREGVEPAGCAVIGDGHLKLVEGFRLPEEGFDHSQYPDLSINSFLFTAEAIDQDLPIVPYAAEKKVDGRKAVQLERVSCEVTSVSHADGTPVLKLACLRVPREGPPGEFFDGRFYPVKTRADLREVRAELTRTRVREGFQSKFPDCHGELPIHAAHGRISLFGNFSDLAAGLAITAGLDRGLTGAFQTIPSDDPDARKVIVHSEQESDHPAVIDLDGPAGPIDPNDWTAYIASSVRVLDAYAQTQGKTIQGIRGYFTSDLPVGSGMSSSAALEILILKALADANGIELTPKQLADMAQEAESAIAPTGKLDQYAITYAERAKANLFNAKSESSEAFSADVPGYAWGQIFTEKRQLVHARYPQRKIELTAARDELRVLLGRPDLVLAEVTAEELELHLPSLSSDAVRKRAMHTVYEHARTLKIAQEYLPQADVKKLGQAMIEADDSYHDLLEVGTPFMREISRVTAEIRAENPGLDLYAAASGGGDGGPVNLFGPADQLDRWTQVIIDRVEARIGKVGTPYEISFDRGLERHEAEV